MILSDWMIKQVQMKHQLITPFKEELLQPNGYDIRLGDTILVPKKIDKVIDISRGKLEMEYEEHRLDEDGFILKPKQFILVATYEYVRIPHFLVAIVWNRSSMARLGIRVRGDAGFIDSGFEGNIALEIYNDSENSYLLRKGYKIAQLVFYQTFTPEQLYDGVYKGQTKDINSRGV